MIPKAKLSSAGRAAVAGAEVGIASTRSIWTPADPPGPQGHLTADVLLLEVSGSNEAVVEGTERDDECMNLCSCGCGLRSRRHR